MSTLLVLLETDGERVLDGSLSAIAFAQSLSRKWDVEFDLLAIGGPEILTSCDSWVSYGARTLWCVSQADLAHPTADRIAYVCLQVAEKCSASALVGVAGTFGKDVLPRIAETRSSPMVSDVIAISDQPEGLQFVRLEFAGNVVSAVEISARSAVFSVRAASFRDPENTASVTEIVRYEVDPSNLPSGTKWISLHAAARNRPELTTARIVVSGGRPLKDAETFERLLGGLADTLHGAVGATRAAVDSGIAPNELQVGQTGKVVAPDLYIAAGVSGSVQHLAGMKDSRVIVAINTDPSAPIFDVADYGLVADLYDAVPELTEAIRSAQ